MMTAILKALAGLVAIACGAVLVARGVMLLPEKQASAAPDSSIALSVEGDVDAASLYVRVPSLSGTERESPVRLYFSANLGVAEKVTENLVVPERSASTPTESVDRFSVVLAGPIRDAIIDCNDPAFKITRGVVFDELTMAEQAAITSAVRARSSSTAIAGAQDQPSLAEVTREVDDQEFTVIQPSALYLYDSQWTLSTSDDNLGSYWGYYNYATCDFAPGVFWSEASSLRTFSFPTVSGATMPRGEGHVSSTLRWELRVRPAALLQVAYAEGAGSESVNGSMAYESWSSSRDAKTSMLTSAGMRLSLRDLGAARDRELAIFLAGIGASILASLLGAILVWFSRIRIRRRRAAAVAPPVPEL